MLRDPCGRPVTNLRVSVIRECNQRCLYCHREGEPARTERERLSREELGRVARVAASLGIGKLKLTGGEPLLRRDLPGIIGDLAPLFGDVSLTTNGILLPPLAARLKEAGLGRVNISLDSVDPATYARMTGSDRLAEAVEGVRAARRAGLSPVKLNMVVIRGENGSQIPQMMRFSASEGAVLQLIELEAPKGRLSGEWYSEHHTDLSDVERELARRAVRTTTRRMHHRRKYVVPLRPGSPPGPGRGGKEGAGTVEIEIVRPVHNSEFCQNCNRLRLSSDGRLVPCLFRGDRGVDIAGPLRRGATDGELAGLFACAVSRREPYWTGAPARVPGRGRGLGACP
ncbi:MAG: GTP 3',8-cyclase MoaA [Euryarchaeota archaeon]|nr:GTP 3',8-cyclase MoaA [Euryarchaeota archaeon]